MFKLIYNYKIQKLFNNYPNHFNFFFKYIGESCDYYYYDYCFSF